MPPSADLPAASDAEDAAQELALLTEACAAYEAGDRAKAAELFDRIGRTTAGLPQYRALEAAVAADRGDGARAVEALKEACALQERVHGRPRASLLVDLADLCVHTGRFEEALEVRTRAEAVVATLVAQRPGTMAEERRRLGEVDARLAHLLWREGRHDEAIAAQLKVVSAAPRDLAKLRSLRTSLSVRDRLAEALLVQLRIMLLLPEEGAPARDVGQLLQGLGATAAARAWFRRALALRPDDRVAQEGLDGEAGAGSPPDAVVERLARPLEGMAGAPRDPLWPMAAARSLLATRGSPPAGAVADAWSVLARDAAAEALRRVIALRPTHGEAVADLAALTLERGDDEEGVALLRGALKLAPSNASLHMRLGFELRYQWKLQEAQQSHRVALALDPDLAQAMVGLADALLAEGPDPRALALVERAAALDPLMPALQCHLLRAQGLLAQGRREEALDAFQAALALQPDHANCRFGMGLVLLSLGRLEEGWPHYAQRWRISQSADAWRAPADPDRRPDPSAWRGRTVLVYSEQALGDTIQFLRYARMVAACGVRVLLEVQAPLKSLAASIPDIAGVYSREDGVPPFDEAVALMDLPWAFGTTLETIPATIPYLRGDLERAAQFRRRMRGLPGLKVGLVWSGNPRPDIPNQAAMDRRRSLTLAALAPLAKVPGVVFVSLQLGAAAAQAAEPPEGMVLHDWTAELTDFTVTAALMTSLDLVISVDTAPAHLAGALGREVWLLNRADTDFRWLLNRDDSPWYPTLRQFRQTRPGVWDDVILRVAEALRERARRA